MSKNVLILSGSPRKGGNSDILCDEFKRGAESIGHNVEKIFVADKNISYCKGCYYCSNHDGKCVINDDMGEILDKIEKADVLVLASPVYFYSISAQLKTVIDRCVARWMNIKNKEFYYIMTAGDTNPNAMNGTLGCFRGLAACFGSSVEKGIVFGKGLYPLGAVKDTPYMEQAFEMGKTV